MFVGHRGKAVGSEKTASLPGSSAILQSAYLIPQHVLHFLGYLPWLTSYSGNQAADTLVESAKQGTDFTVVIVGACSTAQKLFGSGCARPESTRSAKHSGGQ